MQISPGSLKLRCFPLSSWIDISVDGNGNPKLSLNFSTPIGSIEAAGDVSDKP